MTQIGYICTKCKASILEDVTNVKILEDEERIKQNEESRKHNVLEEQIKKQQHKELNEIAIKLYELYECKKNSHKGMRYEHDVIHVNLWNNGTWYVFTEEEAKRFTPKTGLHTCPTENGKLVAYFTTNVLFHLIHETKYLLCPICNTKNYLPLTSLILK